MLEVAPQGGGTSGSLLVHDEAYLRNGVRPLTALEGASAWLLEVNASVKSKTNCIEGEEKRCW